jgi:hypothetical protein
MSPNIKLCLWKFQVETMNIFTKIVTGDGLRRTRLNDEKGNRVDLRGLAYAPRTFAEALLRLASGIRPEQPWISYRAASRLDELIKADWRAAEFGSGMSTLWLAQRVAFLLSVEDDPRWYELVSTRLKQGQFPNVRQELRQLTRYADLSEFPDGYFDFILVDGVKRSDCVLSAIAKTRPGGWVYLDNTDKDGDYRLAEKQLVAAVNDRNGTLKYYVDFVPCQLIACQGLLARL